MAVVFVFSDESGSYKRRPGRKFLRAHPFYCRVALAVPVNVWLEIRPGFERLRSELPVPEAAEVKWSHITSVIQHRRRGETIPKNRPYAALASASDEELLNYVDQTLALISDQEDVWSVHTFHENGRGQGQRRETILKFHLQDIMQRTEMELRSREDLGVLLFDSIGKADDVLLRDTYAEIYREGDIIERYRYLKDTIGFEASHQSFGICLADYCIGTFRGFLKRYNTSRELWLSRVWPTVRRSQHGNPLGYGLIEVPKSPELRDKVAEMLPDYGS